MMCISLGPAGRTHLKKEPGDDLDTQAPFWGEYDRLVRDDHDLFLTNTSVLVPRL